jgi:hypothetical protein
VALPSHERPILLLVPGPAGVAEALRALLTHVEVRAYALPAVWDLSFGAVDAMKGLPRVPRLDLDNLPGVVRYLADAATPEALDAWLSRTWQEIHDRVRQWYLKRGAMSVLGSLFKLGKPSSAYPPPPAFRSDRVHAARFEVTYRLHVVAGTATDSVAPAEEASVAWYPFDPRDGEGRSDAGLPADGPEWVLEVFAYEAGRARHLRVLSAVAAASGWRVVDTPAEGTGP